MLYITMTELRTKTAEIAESMLKGTSISLVHRSKIIGYIQPASKEPKTFNAEKVMEAVKKLNIITPITNQQIEDSYRQQLTEKYGKNIS